MQEADLRTLDTLISEKRVLMLNKNQESEKLKRKLASAQNILTNAQTDIDALCGGKLSDLIPSRKAERLAALESAKQRAQNAQEQIDTYRDAIEENRRTRQKLQNELDRAIEKRESLLPAQAPVIASPEEKARIKALLSDALGELSRAYQYTVQALGSAQNAQGLSTFDFFLDTGIIGDLYKHDHLRSSQSAAQLAQDCLQSVKRKLALLPESERLYFANVQGVSTGLFVWDVWFDDLISHLMVHNVIKQNVDAMSGQLGKLNTLRRALEKRIQSL